MILSLNRSLHTSGSVIFQYGIFDFAQGGFNRLHLLQHINAVPPFINHATDAANLSLDATEATYVGVLLYVHRPYLIL
jgi:hypothetical protein